jgi:hypothetical protein
MGRLRSDPNSALKVKSTRGERISGCGAKGKLSIFFSIMHPAFFSIIAVFPTKIN